MGRFCSFTVSVLILCCCCGLRAADPLPIGDCNLDQRVDLSDAIYILHYLFQGDAPNGDQPGCDFSGNGKTDIADAISLISYLLLGAPPPKVTYSVMLAWDPVRVDQQGVRESVSRYRVYLLNQGSPVLYDEVQRCSCVNLIGLKRGVKYLFAVSAIDQVGNESPLSAPFTILR
jgi:hypothetical protein